MNDKEPPTWTLDQHLSAGKAALSQIGADHMHINPDQVCHHFSAVNPVDPMTVSVEATYRHLSERFSA
jgi:hypothetical protein